MGDAELIERIRRGDGDAFDALYRRYNRRLFGYIRRLVRDRDTAEDLLQEVLLKVLRDRTFTGGNFAGWLFTVARNACVSHLRCRDGRPQPGELPELADLARSPEQAAARRESLQAVGAAVSELPPTHQDALLLKQLGELTYGEIAAIQGVPEGTVKSRLHHAIRDLQRRLSPSEIGEPI